MYVNKQVFIEIFENDVWIILVEVSGCDLESGCESLVLG